MEAGLKSRRSVTEFKCLKQCLNLQTNSCSDLALFNHKKKTAFMVFCNSYCKLKQKGINEIYKLYACYFLKEKVLLNNYESVTPVLPGMFCGWFIVTQVEAVRGLGVNAIVYELL